MPLALGEDPASGFKRRFCDGEQGSNNEVREYKYLKNVFEVWSFLRLAGY